jgi:hypothetical protein
MSSSISATHEIPNVHLVTGLSPAHIVRRIGEATASRNPFCSYAKAHRIYLWKKPTFIFRHMKSIVMACDLNEIENGTIIECSFLVTRKMFVLLYVALNIGIFMVLLFSLIFVAFALAKAGLNPGRISIRVFGPICLTCGMAASATNYFLSRRDPKLLKQFVMNLLEAGEC